MEKILVVCRFIQQGFFLYTVIIGFLSDAGNKRSRQYQVCMCRLLE